MMPVAVVLKVWFPDQTSKINITQQLVRNANSWA